MKLSNVFAKLTCIKTHAVRVLATAAVAGAVFAATAPAAEAQHFAVSVHTTGPYHEAPPPVYERGHAVVYGHERAFYAPEPRFYGPSRDFYERRRSEEREAFRRHEEWERAHYDHRFGYGR